MSTRTNRGTWIGRTFLAGAAALLAGGCASGPRVTGFAPLPDDRYKAGGKPNRTDPYVFTVRLVNGCPTNPEMEEKFRNCPDAKPDCVRVRRGQTVKFTAATPKDSFVLQLDPFGVARLTVTGGTYTDAGGTPKDAVFDALPDGKLGAYLFGIAGTDPKCPAVDPELILD
jgi:hypothetical protein